MNSVPSNILQKAKERIREDESRKDQSMIQLKEWLAKHAFIKYCRTDDVMMLAQLRARKYRMDRVFDCLERSMIFVHEHRDWFDWNGDKFQRIFELYDTGFLKVMKNRDSEGRRVIISNNIFDSEKFNADDIFRLACFIVLVVSNEEETQLCGLVYINDYSNSNSMKYLSLFPLKSIYDFTVQMSFVPLRLCKLFVIGLPSFATQTLNMIKLAVTNKIKERLIVLDSQSQLHEHIDKSILTTDVGGEINERETIEDLRKNMNELGQIAREFFNTFELDIEKATMLKNAHENVGSFRKLEID